MTTQGVSLEVSLARDCRQVIQMLSPVQNDVCGLKTEKNRTKKAQC